MSIVRSRGSYAAGPERQLARADRARRRPRAFPSSAAASTAVMCCGRSPGFSRLARIFTMRNGRPVSSESVSAVRRIWPPPSPREPSSRTVSSPACAFSRVRSHDTKLRPTSLPRPDHPVRAGDRTRPRGPRAPSSDAIPVPASAPTTRGPFHSNRSRRQVTIHGHRSSHPGSRAAAAFAAGGLAPRRCGVRGGRLRPDSVLGRRDLDRAYGRLVSIGCLRWLRGLPGRRPSDGRAAGVGGAAADRSAAGFGLRFRGGRRRPGRGRGGPGRGGRSRRRGDRRRGRIGRGGGRRRLVRGPDEAAEQLRTIAALGRLGDDPGQVARGPDQDQPLVALLVLGRRLAEQERAEAAAGSRAGSR